MKTAQVMIVGSLGEYDQFPFEGQFQSASDEQIISYRKFAKSPVVQGGDG